MDNKQIVYAIKDTNIEFPEAGFAYLDLAGIFRYADTLECDTDYEQPKLFITQNEKAAKLKLKSLLKKDLYRDAVLNKSIIIEKIEINISVLDNISYDKL